jgi:pyrroloquinoline quinone (PQQ) biosynthesis protein C
MPQLPGWMPELLSLINQACLESPMFARVDDEQVFQTARAVCLSLWPFIRDLPDNIACVRAKTPFQSEAAEKFFAHLADEERVFQQLYRKQCRLAGISDDQLENVAPSAEPTLLSQVMQKHCRAENYLDGVLAIITAELGAAAWSRNAQPIFENYFAKHIDRFDVAQVEDGLQWLRLHAKPNLKHAIWLRKLLDDFAFAPQDKMPEPVREILGALKSALMSEERESVKTI